MTSRPKPLFTQASLVAELKRLGIGRPSTYQAVVPLVLSRGWVEEKPQTRSGGAKAKSRSKPLSLVPTNVGMALADFLVQALPSLVDYAFTASLETALDDVETSTQSRTEVGHRWWTAFEPELERARALPVQKREPIDLGECPKCKQEGRTGRLRLIKGVSRTSGKLYEFAGCTTDTRTEKPCGFTGPVEGGVAVPSGPCPDCGEPTRPVRRRDGAHALVCGKHGWFLADGAWQPVKSPSCPTCGRPMVHRERGDRKGTFVWACFQDGVFGEADASGALKGELRSRRPAAESP